MSSELFSREKLKLMIVPYSKDMPYFRPFLLHGEQTQVDLFLVGINPASRVTMEEEPNPDHWINCLLNYELYDQFFSSKGPTRRGIRGMLKRIKQTYTGSIIETNMNAFPTPKADDLKKASIKEAVEAGKKQFIQLLSEHEPAILILHGQTTVREFRKTLIKLKWIKPRDLLSKTKIREREQQFPILEFVYPSGKSARVFACRHLCLYQDEGLSFQPFLSNLTKFI